MHPQGPDFRGPSQKQSSLKKLISQRSKAQSGELLDKEFIVDRDVLFPSSAGLASNEKLRQKIKVVKEKIESDISSIQNEMAGMQRQNAELLQAFQRCLDEGMQARDQEMLRFEKATNQALMDLKNWVLRKRPNAEYLGMPGGLRGDDGQVDQRSLGSFTS